MPKWRQGIMHIAPRWRQVAGPQIAPRCNARQLTRRHSRGISSFRTCMHGCRRFRAACAIQARSGLLTVRWEWRPSRGHQRGVDSIQVSRKPQAVQVQFWATPCCQVRTGSGLRRLPWGRWRSGHHRFAGVIQSAPLTAICRGALVRRTDGRRQHRTGWSARWPRAGTATPVRAPPHRAPRAS